MAASISAGVWATSTVGDVPGHLQHIELAAEQRRARVVAGTTGEAALDGSWATTVQATRVSEAAGLTCLGTSSRQTLLPVAHRGLVLARAGHFPPVAEWAAWRSVRGCIVPGGRGGESPLFRLVEQHLEGFLLVHSATMDS